ncbi:hypothetical protein [Methylobacterium aquaticum]|uniref:hypothetical protein n=1 Tax=Methylobacterium aquaticum TaxID=270351 RepID=UPI0019345DEB|nr:hypothetical protein [Methylobacterium aquaticum]QRE74238.1 hypothetical protein F1D61_12010 [Methylobacterium aquaticum]
MIPASAASDVRMTSSAIALKMLNETIVTSKQTSFKQAAAALDTTSKVAKIASTRTLDAITNLKRLDRNITSEDLAAMTPTDRFAMQFVASAPYLELPSSMLKESISAKDEAFMRGLGANGWVAHYAPKLSPEAFEAAARKSLDLMLPNNGVVENYLYYKDAFEDVNTKFVLSNVDNHTLVGRDALETTRHAYQIQMSLRHALDTGNIAFSRPEDEVGLDYIGVSYDMYKDGKFEGNMLNYTQNSDYLQTKQLERTVIYTWNIGLLGFLAKFDLLSLNEIERKQLR